MSYEAAAQSRKVRWGDVADIEGKVPGGRQAGFNKNYSVRGRTIDVESGYNEPGGTPVRSGHSLV